MGCWCSREAEKRAAGSKMGCWRSREGKKWAAGSKMRPWRSQTGVQNLSGGIDNGRNRSNPWLRTRGSHRKTPKSIPTPPAKPTSEQ